MVLGRSRAPLVLDRPHNERLEERCLCHSAPTLVHFHVAHHTPEGTLPILQFCVSSNPLMRFWLVFTLHIGALKGVRKTTPQVLHCYAEPLPIPAVPSAIHVPHCFKVSEPPLFPPTHVMLCYSVPRTPGSLSPFAPSFITASLMFTAMSLLAFLRGRGYIGPAIEGGLLIT